MLTLRAHAPYSVAVELIVKSYPGVLIFCVGIDSGQRPWSVKCHLIGACAPLMAAGLISGSHPGALICGVGFDSGKQPWSAKCRRYQRTRPTYGGGIDFGKPSKKVAFWWWD